MVAQQEILSPSKDRVRGKERVHGRKLIFLHLFLLFSIVSYAADITSQVLTGNWNNNGSWVGGVRPVAGDNVTIASGATINMNVNATINNLIVEEGAILNLAGQVLTVTGNITINGEIIGNDGNTERLVLSGTGTTISGTGQVESGWRTRVSGGDKEILAGSDLTWTGGTNRFTINDNITITNNGSIALRNEIRSGGNNTTWVQGANSTVSINNTMLANDGNRGIFTASAAGNTVIYGGGDQTIRTSTGNTYHSLTAAGTGTKSLPAALTVNGDITISSELNVTASNYAISLAGNWTSTGRFNERNGTVTINGTGDQTFTNNLGETFYNLTINKSSGTMVLADDIGVDNTLDMTAGNINTDDNVLTLGTGTGNVGTFTYTSGYILGSFRRWITTTATNFDFPLGTATEDRNLRVNFTSLTSGSLTATFQPTSPGNAGLSLDDNGTTVYNNFAEGFWSLTDGDGLISTDFDLSLTAGGFVSQTIDANSRLLSRVNSTQAWETSGNHSAAVGSVINRTEVSRTNGDFAIASTSNCMLPVTSTITPATADVICTNASQTYSVTLNAGNTYNWEVVGGTIDDAGGATTYTALDDNSITVTWGATGGNYELRVSETSPTCGEGFPETLAVDVNPVATSAISGAASVAASSTSIAYHVTETAGYTYDWDLPDGGGTLSEDASGTASVDWGGTGGTYRITALATSTGACGNAALVTLNVDVYDEVVSSTTGNWNNNGIWVGGARPVTTDNVRIATGHTVTMNVNATIVNLTVDEGATLNLAGQVLTVTGDLTVNGAITGNGGNTERLILSGADRTISGTGTVESDWRTRVSGGNKTIAADADITWTGGTNRFTIDDNLTITNYGSISLRSDVRTGGAGTTWINQNNSTLTIRNTFFANDGARGDFLANASGNTVIYSGGDQTLRTPISNQFYNLTIAGTGTKSMGAALEVLGDLSISSELNVTASNYQISLSGDWTNAGFLNERSGTIRLVGDGNQTITNALGEEFYDLIVQKSSGSVVLGGDVTVTNALAMLAGDVSTASQILTLGTSTANTGTLSFTSGTIQGNFRRWIAAATTDIDFPLGSTFSEDRNFRINFDNISGGTLTAAFITANPGSGGLPVDDGGFSVTNVFAEGYWQLTTADGLATTSANLNFTGENFTSFTIDADTRIISRSASDVAWAVRGTHAAANVASSIANRTGVAALSGQYAFADNDPCTPSIPDAINTTEANPCGGERVTYSIQTPNGTSTYHWRVTGGTIVDGGGTVTYDAADSSIEIDWGNTPGSYSVEVSETAVGCGEGDAISLAVNVNPLATSPVSGVTSAVASSSESYSIEGDAGYTYNWSLTGGGAFNGGSTGTNVTVDWGAVEGSYTLQVDATSPGGCSAPIPVTLEVGVFEEAVSQGTANWNNGGNWSTGQAPATTQSARIATGHTVTLNVSPTVVNLTVDEGATLNLAGQVLTVSGNLVVNGSIVGNGGNTDRLILTGTNTSISGTGSVESDWRTRISGGNKTILAGSDLNWTGGTNRFTIDDNITITNRGSINLRSDVRTGGNGTVWINDENSTLVVRNSFFANDGPRGTFSASAPGNTVSYAGGDQTLRTPINNTFHNLSLEGTGTKSIAADLLLEGNVNITSELNVTASNYQLEVQGDWTSSGFFNEREATVIFSGANDQMITNDLGETFYNFELNKTGGTITLTDDINVTNTLTMISGGLSTGTAKVVLGTGIANPGTLTYTDGLIVGNMERWAMATGTDYLFPIGTTSGNKRNVTVNFAALTSGTVIASFTSSSPGTGGFPIDDAGFTLNNPFSDGFWSLAVDNGFASSQFDLDLQAVGFSSFTFDTDTRVVARANNLNPWVADGGHLTANLGSTTARRGTMSQIPGDYALADSDPCTPSVPDAINTGDATPCTGETVAYSIATPTVGSTYNWEVSGGTIDEAGGITTYSALNASTINVTWGPNPGSYSVRVSETSATCGAGDAIELGVTLNPIPTSAITGALAVTASNSAGYSVEETAGYTYNWSLTGGGAFNGGSTGTSVTIDWGAIPGTYTVQVDAVSAGGCSAPDAVTLDVTVQTEIVSQTTGNWNNNATWAGNVRPVTTDNVRIATGHTVTLNVSPSIVNLTVDEGAVLNLAGQVITVTGDLVVNGSIVGNGGNTDRLILSGTNRNISGGGSVESDWRTRVSGGNKTILAGSDLTFTGGTNRFTIDDNITITNNGSISLRNEIRTGGNGSTWINAANSTLTVRNQMFMNDGVRGNFSASAEGNTVIYSGGDQTLRTPISNQFYNLSLEGTGTKSMAAALEVQGNLAITSELNVTVNNYQLTIGGDWSNTGLFNQQTGTVLFNGTGAQSISNELGEDFYNLVVDKPSGTLSLSNNVTASNILSLQSGVVDASSTKLTLGTGTSNTGTLTYLAGHVSGPFERWINSTGTDILMPVGDGTSYLPATINFTNLVGGSLIAEFVNSSPGTINILDRPLDDNGFSVYNVFSDGYWTLTRDNSLTSVDYDLSLDASSFSSFTINADTRILFRDNEVSDWTLSGTHQNAVGAVTNRIDIASLSAQFALGDPTNCNPPTPSGINTSNATPCVGTDVTYSIPSPTGGNTYSWEVVGGTIAENANLPSYSAVDATSITVTWTSTGAQSVSVRESTASCGGGDLVTLDVAVNPIETSAITGNTDARISTLDEPYSVELNTGYGYVWSLPDGGGTISSTDNTAEVDWGGATGTYRVRVVATSTGGCGALPAVETSVTLFDEIVSNQTGNWNNNGTWVGGVRPTTTDNVRIAPGHTVTLNISPTIVSLTVDAGASLNLAGQVLTASGDLEVNGSIVGNGGNTDRLILTGTGTTISGVGTVESDWRTRISGGNKTISVGTDLSFTGGTNRFTIDDNITVTNNGTISLQNEIRTGGNGTIWINAANSTLTVRNAIFVNDGVRGTFIASANNNTVVYAGGDQTLRTPQDNDFYNLIIGGTGTKSMAAALDILGDLTINTTLNATVNNYALSVAGNWTNTGFFEEQNGTVSFTGSGDQTITNALGEEFYNFTINKPAGDLNLGGNVTITNELDLNQGSIVTGANNLVLGTSAVNEGTLTYTAGRVIGAFERWVTNSSPTTYLFPVGTAGNPRLATFEFNTIDVNGTVIVSFSEAAPGSNGFDLNDGGTTLYNPFVDGFWDVSGNNSFASSDYNVDLTATGFTSFAIDTETRVMNRDNATVAWALEGNHVAGNGATSVVGRNNINGITTQLGLADDTNCDPPVTSAISGVTDVCNGDTQTYSVTNNAGNTYAWTITGGTQVSGLNTNSIDVLWDTPGVGTVQVVESGGNCGPGTPGEAVTLSVDVNPLPTSAIAGTTSLATDTQDEPYSVTLTPGYTYLWSLSGGGTIDTDAAVDDESIIIDWGSSTGTFTITAEAVSGGCGNATPVTLDVTLFDEVQNDETGNWNNNGTWVTNVRPVATDNVRIISGTTVTLNVSPTIQSLYVEAGATLNLAGQIITVTGNLTVDGSITGTGGNTDRLVLSGIGTTIAGTGTVESDWRTRISGGNKTIEPGTSLTFSGGTNRFTIDDNITVTNNGTFISQNEIRSGGAGSTWINAANSTLEIRNNLFQNDGVRGVFSASASGNTVLFAGGDQTIRTPDGNTFHHLTIAGTGTKTMAAALTVAGDLTIQSTLDVSGSNFGLIVNGDWTNTGFFTERNGTVTFGGTIDQTVTNSLGETFYGLTVGKPSGQLLTNQDIQVDNALTLTGGIVNLSGQKLTLGSGGVDGTLTRSSGYIRGDFERFVNATVTDYLFPIGSSSDYLPITSRFTDLTVGSLIANFVEGSPGALATVPLTDGAIDLRNTFTEGYWTLTTQNSLNSTNYQVTVEGNGFSSFTIDTDTRLVTRPNVAANWNLDGSHGAVSSSTVSRTGLTSISAQYALADDTDCTQPTTSAITGANSVCESQSGVLYSVANTPGSTYNWSVVGGTITAGQGQNQISVTWGSLSNDEGVNAQVQVIETNSSGCNGAAVTLDVDINPVATSVISGLTSVAEGTTNLLYAVDNNANYTYAWSLSGGGTTDASTTNELTVDWTSTGTFTLTVIASSDNCGGAAAQAQTLDVEVFPVVTSQNTGNWNNAGSWDLGVPATSNSVRIATGHTITLNTSPTIVNLIVESGATLNLAGNVITVTGSLQVDGDIIGNGGNTDRLILSGSGTSISGTGTIESDWRTRISGGNKTIAFGSDLTFTGGNNRFTINDNITITNNGSIALANDVRTGGAGSTWINAANSTLEIRNTFFQNDGNRGTFSASAAGNTVVYAGGGDQTLRNPVGGAYHHLTLAGGGNKSLPAATIINGDLTISSSLDVTGSNRQLTLYGNWTNTGTFGERNGTVVLAGATQSITNASGETFYDLNQQSTGTTTITNNTTVSNTLTMTSGNVNVQGGVTLTLGTSAVTPGVLTYTAGNILGDFERYINTTGTDLFFPVGTAGSHRPATLNFTNLSGGSVIVSFQEVDPTDVGLPLVDGNTLERTFDEGYWQLTAANALASTNFSLTLVGADFTSYTISDNARILKRTGANWTVDGTHGTRAGNELSRTAINGVNGDYAFAIDNDCQTIVTSAITGGAVDACAGAPTETYTVTLTSGNTYDWTVAGGTITSASNGVDLNSITVDWTTGGLGDVSVTETRGGCPQTDSETLAVNVHPIPLSAISGSTGLVVNSTGETYSVDFNSGYTYSWGFTTLTGSATGTIVSTSPNGSSIDVDWSNAGSARLTASATSPFGCANPTDQTVDVVFFSTFNSTQNGNFSDPATWACNCVPPTDADVIIDHDVTMDMDFIANDLTIQAGHTLDNTTFNLIVRGDYVVQAGAAHAGTTGTITLGGDGTKTLSGTGTISNTSGLTVGNNMTLSAGADLSLTNGNLIIGSAVVLTNDGSLTVAGNVIGSNATSTFTNTGTGILTVSGALLSTGRLNASASGNLIHYNGTAAQNIKGAQGLLYDDLQLSGAGVKTLTSNLTIAGNLNSSGGNLALGVFTLSLLGTWTNSAVLAGNGTIEYAAPGNQTILDLPYTNLSIAGTGVKTLEANLDCQDLTIAAGATMDVDNTNNYTINISGDWTNGGTFQARSGTVIFDGTTTQNVSVTGSGAFNNVTMNNTAASNAIVLNSAVTITGTLTLTDGIVRSSVPDPLTVRASGTIVGGSNDSFVDGVLRRGFIANNVDVQLAFPVGVGRLDLVQLQVNHQDATETYYTAQYFETGADLLSHVIVPMSGIDRVNPGGYWAIEQEGGGSTLNANGAQVTLNYNDGSISDAPNLRIAKSDGAGNWENLGGAGSANVVGDITSSGFDTFSDFALANATGGGNTLPVELLDFRANLLEAAVQLQWSTATEIDNEQFVIERSQDGRVFSAIGEVAGAGDSEQLLNYEFFDQAPMVGLNFYRLRQVDFDGSEELSQIVMIVYETIELGLEVKAYPNPVQSKVFFESNSSLTGSRVKVYHMNGMLLLDTNLQTPEDGLLLDQLSSGVYHFVLESPLGTRMLKVIKQ